MNRRTCAPAALAALVLACLPCPCLSSLATGPAPAPHATPGAPGSAAAEAPCLATGSPLAFASVVPATDPIGGAEARIGAGSVPELWLAQRPIEREWVTPDDSIAVAHRVPGGKSEISATLLSAMLPGTGELYVGEASGFAFLAAELVSLVGFFVMRRDAEDLREAATIVAGVPTDSASAWSFERWSTTTGEDPAQLEAIYTQDPDSFWDMLARDPSLNPGWSNAADANEYSSIYSDSNLKQRRSNQFGTVIWINHLVSAADALRAAKLHNLTLGKNLELRARGGFKRGEPSLLVTVMRKF